MKKVVYLHGLETPQGGDKVSLLSENHLVWAPAMDYDDPKLFEKILDTLKDFEPDYIIGSSRGGYFGFVLASHFPKVKVLLFNPALFDRPTESDNEFYGDFGAKGTFVLGEKDDVVDPKETINRVDRNKHIKIELIKNGTHRTPYLVFKTQLSKFL